MNKLHPGAKWQFRIGGYVLGILVLIFGSFAIIGAAAVLKSWAIGLTLLIILLVIIIVGAEIFAQMTYNRWFYELTAEGVRLERGIIWKRYSTIPYARIQNVDVHRGIIARIAGFSSIMIQTAGYSAQPHAEGQIPAVGVEEAEQIRGLLMQKITGKRT